MNFVIYNLLDLSDSPVKEHWGKEPILAETWGRSP